MILVLKRGVAGPERTSLQELAVRAGRVCRFVPASDDAVVAILDGGRDRPDPDLAARARLWPGVMAVVEPGEELPLTRAAVGAFAVAPRHGRPVTFGPRDFVWIAGPCSVEDPTMLGEVATAVAAAGATMLRGGAYKPRTSPYSFAGHGREGLLLLERVAQDVGLPVVSEVLDVRDVDFVAQHVDMLQVGARNMQNFPLLSEVGACGRPVLLKRGPASTLDELLAAAEYVLHAGCTSLALCERGVRGFDPNRRNVLDLSIVPALRERMNLPVIVDPSHATGCRSLVLPMAKAAVAAGADGVMVEVHSRPTEALSDPTQALLPADLDELGTALRALVRLEQRALASVQEAVTPDASVRREPAAHDRERTT